MLHQAKITTLGERVEDIFFISNQYHAPLTDAEAEKLSVSLANAFNIKNFST